MLHEKNLHIYEVYYKLMAAIVRHSQTGRGHCAQIKKFGFVRVNQTSHSIHAQPGMQHLLC